MGKMDEAALELLQTTSRNYNQALRILSECPEDLLQYIDRSESHWVLSPAVSKMIRDGDYQADMPLAVAARIPRGKKRPTEKDALFLVMDGNVVEPAFALEHYTTTSFRGLAKADGKSLDEKGVDLILTDIENWISSTVQRRKDDKQRTRRRRRRAAVKTVASIIGVTAVAAGALYGIHWKQAADRQEAAKQQAAQNAAVKAFWDKIAAYDVKNVILQSPVLAPDSAGLAHVDRFALSLLGETPPLEDLLANPRKAVILAGETKMLIKAPLGKGVRVVSDAPEGHVMVDVLDDGSVWLAALPADGNRPLYNIIIQSQNLPK